MGADTRRVNFTLLEGDNRPRLYQKSRGPSKWIIRRAWKIIRFLLSWGGGGVLLQSYNLKIRISNYRRSTKKVSECDQKKKKKKGNFIAVLFFVGLLLTTLERGGCENEQKSHFTHCFGKWFFFFKRSRNGDHEFSVFEKIKFCFAKKLWKIETCYKKFRSNEN